jgi:SAM-dependent methyltransferase
LRSHAQQLHPYDVAVPAETPRTGVSPDEGQRRHRQAVVTGTLADIVCRSGGNPPLVVIHDASRSGGGLADELAEAIHARGRPCARLPDSVPLIDRDARGGDRAAVTVVIADGPEWTTPPPTGRCDLFIYLRTPPPRPDAHGHGDADHAADIVIDYHDPTWPVIRRVAAHLEHATDQVYLTETRAFFAARAATWDHKFGQDLPSYAAAIDQAAIPEGATVVDVGCGTGRAIGALRTAVGPHGAVIGIDLTPHMLTVACDSTGPAARLLLADARHLPLADACVDAIFAAGLIQHLPDPAAGLAELARVTRPDGRLIVFHPSGRAALAARHGRTLREDEALNRSQLSRLLAATGWTLTDYDDPPDRFFALARRRESG